MTRTTLTLARFVLLEARRTGLVWIAAGTALAGIGMAGFVAQLALTESGNLQSGVLAGFFRLCAVFLTATFVVTSMVRESSDKGTELLLSLPMSRTEYYLGKLAGFSACGALLALAYSLIVAIWAPAAGVAFWGVSLALESALVAGVSLFFVVGLGQVIPAMAATAGLYLLSRIVGTIQSISKGPLSDDTQSLQQLSGWLVDSVALLLPSLDTATRTSWLLYEPPSLVEFLGVAAALLLYLGVVCTAGLFDLHRRNL